MLAIIPSIEPEHTVLKLHNLYNIHKGKPDNTMDTKNSNRQKFRQNQKFNNKKNYVYKKKHGILEEKVHSTEEISSDSDDELKFTRRTANDNSKRYEQQFEEDTEEYIQQKKLIQHLEDEEFKRQLKLQNEFIQNEYKDKLKQNRKPYTEDELLNMTTDKLNNLLINKEPKKDTDFKSKLFTKQREPTKPVKKEKESVKDRRARSIPVIPASIKASVESDEKKPRKLRALDAGEDFLDSLL